MFGVDGSLWLVEYRGIPFLGRTGYLTEIAPEELKPWNSKIDKNVADKYVQILEMCAEGKEFLYMEDFDIDDYAQGFLSATT